MSFEVVHATMQGQRAAAEVIDALERLDHHADVDVIVIARGGGSVEDLLPFSDEGLIRAVAKARTPVVSAIGHEPDSPLLDLVADVRASTPTDAAKLIVPDVAQELAAVDQARQRIRHALDRWLDRERAGLDALRSRPVLADPRSLRRRRGSRSSTGFRDRCRRTLRHALDRAADDIDHQRARARALSPLATLERGYAVLQDADGHVVTTVDGRRGRRRRQRPGRRRPDPRHHHPHRTPRGERPMTEEKPSYEEAREELVEVVRRLEAGGTTLEESLALWERGEQLATICQEWLDGARKRLDEVIEKSGAVVSDSTIVREVRPPARSRRPAPSGRPTSAAYGEVAARVGVALPLGGDRPVDRRTGRRPRRSSSSTRSASRSSTASPDLTHARRTRSSSVSRARSKPGGSSGSTSALVADPALGQLGRVDRLEVGVLRQADDLEVVDLRRLDVGLVA